MIPLGSGKRPQSDPARVDGRRRHARGIVDGLPPDRDLAVLAERQHGVVARRQLLTMGLSASAIKRRLHAGRLHPLHRGVYAVGYRPLTQSGLWMAAVLTGGEGALVSYRSAGSLWRILPAIDGPVHVSLSGHRQRQPGIVFHRMRSLGAGERTKLHGVPVTSIARTLLDLATRLRPRELRNAFEEAERLELLHRPDLARLCERTSGRRGTGVLRALLAARPLPFADTRSGLERRFLRYCRDRALPIPAVNVPLAGYVVDCLWRNQRVAVELDSWAYHGDRESFEADRRRDARIQRAGHRIIRVTKRRIDLEADHLEDELRALLGLARPAQVVRGRLR